MIKLLLSTSLVALVCACSNTKDPDFQGKGGISPTVEDYYPSTNKTRQSNESHSAAAEPSIVDAACGQCLLGLTGKKGCDLAVTVQGKSYFVDGVSMEQLGDAHAADGICNVVRKAEVVGEVRDGRFVASQFKLLPNPKP